MEKFLAHADGRKQGLAAGLFRNNLPKMEMQMWPGTNISISPLRRFGKITPMAKPGFVMGRVAKLRR